MPDWFTVNAEKSVLVETWRVYDVAEATEAQLSDVFNSMFAAPSKGEVRFGGMRSLSL